MIEINIELLGKPEEELNLDQAKPEDFKKWGEKIKERLERVSYFVEVLEEKSWERAAGLYSISFCKDITKKQAEEELKLLNIQKEEIELEEWDFDEED